MMVFYVICWVVSAVCIVWSAKNIVSIHRMNKSRPSLSVFSDEYYGYHASLCRVEFQKRLDQGINPQILESFTVGFDIVYTLSRIDDIFMISKIARDECGELQKVSDAFFPGRGPAIKAWYVARMLKEDFMDVKFNSWVLVRGNKT